MTTVAGRFEVSSNYLARICDYLNVPRPGRGYWAKLAVGKAPAKALLPPAEPGEPESWTGKGGPVVLAKPQASTPPRVRKPRRARDQIHELIRDARAHFENSRPIEDGDYLRPFKKMLVDVTTSKGGLVKALALANNLFNELSAAGYRVALAPHVGHYRREGIDEREIIPKKERARWRRSHWAPQSPTVVYVGTVAIGLSIVEMSENVAMRYANGKYVRESEYVAPRGRFQTDHSWTTTRDLPSGRIRIDAYSPYYEATWSNSWQEEKARTLDGQLRSIIHAIEAAAPVIVEKLAEAERAREAQRRRWEEEERRRERDADRKSVKQSVVDSKAELQSVISRWSDLINTAKFLSEVAERAAALPEPDKSRTLERLALARFFLGDLDPLGPFLEWRTPQERYTSRYPDDGAEGS
ncbi:hypothetical protein [uncultured Reyranella sp.]|uniref:hypothetical protein n=1 Tax=uncultured Reyranella sp. TaxID=735512 RepID=UPI0025F324CB|nr:hypothetical protein [uncultured Reyranella sp.]